MIDEGSPKTEFMRFGDRVKMQAQSPEGEPLFGVIDQQVIKG